MMKLILSFLVCIAKDVESGQSKFVFLAISPEKHGG